MNDVPEVPLMVVSSQLELNIVTAVLEDNDIPFYIKDQSAGNSMRILSGSTIYNAEIIVGEEDYEEAKDLVISVLGEKNFEKY